MLTEHDHIPGAELNKEYSLCHLILTTHHSACYPSLHTSKPTDSGNLLFKALALPITSPVLSLTLILHSHWTLVQLPISD